MHTFPRTRTTVIALACLFLGVVAVAADWPQFRGPERDGISEETGLLTTWPEAGPEVRWRTELGEGFSAISHADDRLFTLFSRDKDEFAVALDAASGKELWRHRLDGTFKDRFGNGPRSTPTVDGEVVFVLGARGKLAALKAADGSVIWNLDLVKELGANIPTWGVSTSPLVEGDLLLVDVGGSEGNSVVAFDKKTGKVAWRSQTDKPGYSSPLAVEIGDRRQILVLTGTQLVSLDPQDGSLFWRQGWETSYDVNASTPIFVPPDRVFISTGYDVGAALYHVTPKGKLEQVWKSREMRNKFSSSVLHDGHLYGFDEKTLKCIHAASGEVRWESRGLGHGSLIYADGHLIALGDKGALVLVEATPEAYREKARAQIFDGKTWTMPTLAGGTLFLRDEHELVALKVSG